MKVASTSTSKLHAEKNVLKLKPRTAWDGQTVPYQILKHSMIHLDFRPSLLNSVLCRLFGPCVLCCEWGLAKVSRDIRQRCKWQIVDALHRFWSWFQSTINASFTLRRPFTFYRLNPCYIYILYSGIQHWGVLRLDYLAIDVMVLWFFS